VTGGGSLVSDAPPGACAPAQEGSSRIGNTVPENRVAGMFDAIAPVYDRMNTLMTAGLDGSWRRSAVRATGLRAGGSALDVACGTGKLTAALARAVGPQGRVVGVDLSEGMLDCARAALADMPGIELRPGNALALPVIDGSFDAATIAFGLRNLADFEAGFREMARAVRSGGAGGLPGVIGAEITDRGSLLHGRVPRNCAGHGRPLPAALGLLLPSALARRLPEGRGDRRDHAPGRPGQRAVQAPVAGGRGAAHGCRALRS
jgi:SAM-dependent methyltransferase